MTITHVQSAINSANTSSSSSITVAFTSTVGSGDLVVGIVTWDAGKTITTVVDDKGNSYNLGTFTKNTGITQDAQCFWLGDITNAPQTLTITFSGSVNDTHAAIDEFASTIGWAANPLTNSAQRYQAAQNSPSSGAFTPPNNGNLIYGAAQSDASSGTIAAGSGFTILNSYIDTSFDGMTLATEWMVQTTAASINPGFTPSQTSEDWVTFGLSFTELPVISLVQSAQVGSSGDTMTKAFTSNVTINDLIIVVAYWPHGQGTPTVTDTLGNTYSLIHGPVYDANTGIDYGAFACYNCKATGACTVTMTWLTTLSFGIMQIHDFTTTGAHSFGWTIDQSAYAAGGVGIDATSGTSGNTGVTTVPFELVFGWCLTSGGDATVGSGFTLANQYSGSGSLTDYKVVNATGVQAAPFTFPNGTWDAWCMTFYYLASVSFTSSFILYGG